MHELPAALERYISRLTITQGDLAGDPFSVLPWQRRFLRGAFAPDVSEAALSVARGAGKTGFVSTLAAACVDPDGPLHLPRGEAVVVASSFAQGKLTFEDVLAFLRERYGDLDRKRWRVQDSQNVATLEYRRTGARLRCIGSNPKRAHSLRPYLVLADEGAQWDAAKADAMLAALKTGLGKLTGSRLIALGTRPESKGHWFSKMLAGGADYCQVHAARPDDPPFQRRTWRRACPSLDLFPWLEAEYRKEAAQARLDPSALAAFKSLRLNHGCPDTIQALLLDAATWERIEGGTDYAGTLPAPPPRPPVTAGPYVLGLDLGQSAAMSAAAGYFLDTGALDCFAVFPLLPALAERGLADGVGRLYCDMAKRGELIQAGRRVSDISALLNECRKRWGAPVAIVADRWREAELRDALESVNFPLCALAIRGQGFKDGGEDVRRFRAACLGGTVRPEVSLLLRSAMSEARVTGDAAGNWKLCKATQGGRRLNARDDAAAAAILAVAEGHRRGAVARPATRRRVRCEIIR